MSEQHLDETIIASLYDYVQSYIHEFNLQRSRLVQRGVPASLFGEEIDKAFVAIASDGIAVFYVPRKERERRGGDPGIELIDARVDTLSEFTQSCTVNQVKISHRNIGDPILAPPHIPDDLPEKESSWGINPDFAEPYVKAGAGVELIGMAVGPTWENDAGVITKRLPSRKRVWSPLHRVPLDGRAVLQFIFPFFDFLWDVHELGLSEESGRQWANADIEILLLGIAAELPQKPLFQDPHATVASQCESVCDEFLLLVDDPDTDEATVQRFLEVPRNQFLIAAHCKEMFPHKPIGGNRYIPDFVLQRVDDDYHLVEIESPNKSIYTKQKQEPSHEFSHAIQQVRDWF